MVWIHENASSFSKAPQAKSFILFTQILITDADFLVEIREI